MNGKGLVAAFVTIIGSVCIQAQASQRLSDEADAVVVAGVQSGQQTGSSLSLALSVTRTIKGDISAGATLTVSGVCAESINRDLAGKYGMFFLRGTNADRWTLLPVVNGYGFEGAYYPLSPTAFAPATTTNAGRDTVDDQIARELAAGTAAPAGSYMLLVTENTLFTAPDTSVTRGLFQSLRTNPNPELRFVALARLMKAGDLSALAEVAASIDLVPNLIARVFVAQAVLGERNSGAAAVTHLGEIAKSADMSLQQSAADALMRLHTQETLPLLADLLNSDFPRSRELAMAGLSRFVENLPPETEFDATSGKSVMPQGSVPYRSAETDRYSLSTRSLSSATEPEAAFLQFWKSWWVTVGSKLRGQNPEHP